MHRDQIKWLVIGLASSVAVIAVLGGIIFASYRLYKNKAEQVALPIEETAEEAPEDGPIAWKREADEYKKQQAEWASYVTPLQAKYTTISPFIDIYKALFADKDFAAIEKALAEIYTQIADPYQAFLYATTVRHLGTLQYDYDPDQLRLIVQQWTDERPDSHFAWLVRGNLEIQYAWYWRGRGAPETVTPKGLENFQLCMKAAEEHLTHAIELDPRDPAVLTSLLQIATETSAPDDEFDRRFERVMSVSPAYYDAFIVKVNRLSPKWNGTWEKLEAFADECDRLAEQFRCPLFRRIRFKAYDDMRLLRPGYEKIEERPEVMQASLDMARQQVELWPDNMAMHVGYCHLLYGHEKYAEAYEQFEWMGDRYYAPSAWLSLAHYNTARAYTIFRVAADTLNEHTQRVEQFERAIALDDSQGIYWYYLGMEHARVYDIKSAEAALRFGIEKDPDSEYPWLGLSRFLAQAGRYDELAELVQDSKRHFEFSNETRIELKQLGALAAQKRREAAAESPPAYVAMPHSTLNP